MADKGKPMESQWRRDYRAKRERLTAVKQRQEDADRARERVLRYEQEDHRRHRWRRRAIAAVTLVSTVAAILGVFLTYVFFQEESAVRAWRLLKDGRGEPGNVGQIAALETLYRTGQDIRQLGLGCWDTARTGIKKPCVYLPGINLAPDGAGFGKWLAFLASVEFLDSFFEGADLTKSDLTGANLSGANLSHANLSHANLSGANLSGANLSHANLTRTNLSSADLSGTNLSQANLSGAHLLNTDLTNAYLGGALNIFDNDLSIACSGSAWPRGLPDRLLNQIQHCTHRR